MRYIVSTMRNLYKTWSIMVWYTRYHYLETHDKNCLKPGIIIYVEYPKNLVVFGYPGWLIDFLNFGAILLCIILLIQMRYNWGFQPLYWKCMEALAWNLEWIYIYLCLFFFIPPQPSLGEKGQSLFPHHYLHNTWNERSQIWHYEL